MKKKLTNTGGFSLIRVHVHAIYGKQFKGACIEQLWLVALIWKIYFKIRKGFQLVFKEDLVAKHYRKGLWLLN